MFRLEINRIVGDDRLTNQEIRKIVSAVLRAELPSVCKKKNLTIGLAFVSEKEIKKSNKIYRRKDEVTDVLSFPEFANKKEIVASREEDIFLGEIVVCCADIDKYARETGKNFEKEAIKVIIHSVLHLLGYEHGKEMFAKQNHWTALLTKVEKND